MIFLHKVGGVGDVGGFGSDFQQPVSKWRWWIVFYDMFWWGSSHSNLWLASRSCSAQQMCDSFRELLSPPTFTWSCRLFHSLAVPLMVLEEPIPVDCGWGRGALWTCPDIRLTRSLHQWWPNQIRLLVSCLTLTLRFSQHVGHSIGVKGDETDAGVGASRGMISQPAGPQHDIFLFPLSMKLEWFVKMIFGCCLRNSCRLNCWLSQCYDLQWIHDSHRHQGGGNRSPCPVSTRIHIRKSQGFDATVGKWKWEGLWILRNCARQVSKVKPQHRCIVSIWGHISVLLLFCLISSQHITEEKKGAIVICQLSSGSSGWWKLRCAPLNLKWRDRIPPSHLSSASLSSSGLIHSLSSN